MVRRSVRFRPAMLNPLRLLSRVLGLRSGLVHIRRIQASAAWMLLAALLAGPTASKAEPPLHPRDAHLSAGPAIEANCPDAQGEPRTDEDSRLLAAADTEPPPAEASRNDRIAARWALATGANAVQLVVGGKEQSVESLLELPAEPFGLVGVEFRSNDQVTNEGLQVLKELSQLQRVALTDCSGLSDFGVLGTCPRLSAVDLAGTQADDSIWKALAPLREIETLNLSRTNLTGERIEDLGARPGLRSLSLDAVPLNNAAARSLRTLFPDLRSLSLRTAGLSPAAFESVAALASLESLTVHQESLSDGVLLAFIRAPRLRSLTVADGTAVASPERIALLEDMESLTFLSCANPTTSTKWLAAFPKLKELTFDATPVTDAGLAELEGIASLKRLTLNGTDVTPKGIEAFRSRRSDIEIVVSSLDPAAPIASRETRPDAPPQTDKADPFVRGVHDPTIVKQGKSFYVYWTGAGIPISQSEDLVHWKRLAPAFTENPEWARKRYPKNEGVWGPDLSFFGGKWHMYYCASAFGTNNSVIGHATNRTLDPSSPTYKWVDHGPVLTSTPGKTSWNALDPHVVLDEAKRPWLMFGSFFSGIKLIRIGADTGKPIDNGEEPISIARRDGAGAIEAPFVIRRGKYFYLFVSHDFCCKGAKSNYRVVVGRSEKLVGPYVDRQNRKLLDGGGTTVLASYGDVRGPGHCSIVQDGDQMWMAHHAYDRARNGVPTLHVRNVIWTGPEGWPLVGEPLTEPEKPAPKSPPSLAGIWKHFVDQGPEFEAVLLPDGSMEGRTASWERTGPLSVQMRFPDQRAEGGAFVNDCYVDPHARWYVCRYGQNTIIRGFRVGTR